MAGIADDDSQQNFILAFVLALIALVIFFVIGIVFYTQSHRAGAKSATSMVEILTETVAVVIPEGASIRVEGGVVNFYFATGSADLAPGAAGALAAVIQGVEGGRKAVISGFHDPSGDGGRNEQLAQRRAEMVRNVLTGLGVPADKVELKKPAVTTGSGNDAEARRVEVKLID